MLVTEVFVFKASASAWPKGKRHGSRPRLKSVRRHEIQMRHNSQFPIPSLQRTIPTGFRANVVYTEIHFQPISCQYPSRKHTTVIPHRMSSSQKTIHPLHSQSTKFENLQMRRMSMSRLQSLPPKLATKTPWARHLESRDTKGLHSLIADGIAIAGWCLSRKCSSSKLQLVPGKRESDMEVDQGWHLRELMKDTRRRQLSVSDSEFPKNKSHWIQGKCLWHRDALSANIMPISQQKAYHIIPQQNEFKSKNNSPTSLTVN